MVRSRQLCNFHSFVISILVSGTKRSYRIFRDKQARSLSDGFEETRSAQMPVSRRQPSSRVASGRRAPNGSQNVENSIPTDGDVGEASLPSEPVLPSEQLQSEDIAQVESANQLEVRNPSIENPPPRQTAPRLASLKTRKPPILSADSTASESPKTKLKFLPKSALRRSKEMRDAAEQAEADRRQSRLAAEAPSTATVRYRGGLQGRGGQGLGRGTGRSDSDRFAGAQASGHLSGGTIGDDGGRKQKVARAGLRAAASEPSRSAGRTKKDIIPKSETEGTRNISGAGPTRTPAVVKEEASSDDEPDIAEGPRVNIEHINLISDDESVNGDPNGPSQHQGGLTGTDKKGHGLNLRPVRVDRHEHVERAIGGSVDHSNSTSAELRRRAQQRQDGEGSLFFSDDYSETGPVKSTNSKSKAREVEFVRDERRWKGVYQDEEEDGEPRIKEEPPEDENRMAVDQVEPVTSVTDRHSPATGEETVTHEVATNVGRPKRKETSDPIASNPQQSNRLKGKDIVFQTEEDRQEWERDQKDLEFLRKELGTTRLGVDHATATMTDDSANLPDHKEGHVYLFQVPPMVPHLLTMADNEKRLKSQAERKNDAGHTSQPSRTSASTKSRPELEDSFFGGRKRTSSDVATPTNPLRTPGKIGTLRVYESGRVKVEWGNAGGASMELHRGMSMSMLQEVIMTNLEQPTVKVETGDGSGDGEGEKDGGGGTADTAMKVEGGSDKEKEKSNEQDKDKEKVNVGDTAWALGELAGSYVLTPDWDQMFKK